MAFNGEQYVTKLPLKPYTELLPDNFKQCLRRLCTLKKKLTLNEQYHDVITSYYKENIIEVVNTPGDVGNVFYLPHRAVVRADRQTTKCRVVFDGSAKDIGPSLNDNLYTGPCLLNLILHILVRFRMFHIGIVSDISQAFLNIRIVDEHRNYLRFL